MYVCVIGLEKEMCGELNASRLMFNESNENIIKYGISGGCINGWCKKTNQDWFSIDFFDYFLKCDEILITGICLSVYAYVCFMCA